MEERIKKLESSVVKIENEVFKVNYSEPWRAKKEGIKTGSGFCIECAINGEEPRKYILTNAHCVELSYYIFVVHRNRKYKAKVVAISYLSDLALVDVEKEVWEHLRPLEMGKTPVRGMTLYACGYPFGDVNFSITKGVFSRLTMQRVHKYKAKSLCLQIDVPINPGNSGGPLIDGYDHYVGVNFMVYSGGQLICYAIPLQLVEYFLEEIASGIKCVYPRYLHTNTQTIDAVTHRYLEKKMNSKFESGILVTRDSAPFKAGDIITSIVSDRFANIELPIQNDNSVIIPYYDEFVEPIYIFGISKTVTTKVLRDGETHTFTHQLEYPQYTIARDEFMGPPSYLIVAGLVFQPLSYFLFMSDHGRYHDYLKYIVAYDLSTEPIEVIMLNSILPHYINAAFDGVEMQRLMKVNDTLIVNLAQMHELIEELYKTSEYIVFEFDSGVKAAVETKECLKYSADILKTFIGDNPGYVSNEHARKFVSPI